MCKNKDNSSSGKVRALFIAVVLSVAACGNDNTMSPCHVLFSGSVAKTFTVTAAMHLYEQGLLDLDEPIAPHLPLGSTKYLVQTRPRKSITRESCGWLHY